MLNSLNTRISYIRGWSPRTYGSSRIRRPNGSHKLSPIAEGIICTGIWAILSVAFALAFGFWGEHAHPEKGVISSEQWAQFLGGIVAQFVLMAVCLSFVAFCRKQKNAALFILLDWRWWLALGILFVVFDNPPLAWVWVGLIYQVRLRRKPKSHLSAISAVPRKSEQSTVTP